MSSMLHVSIKCLLLFLLVIAVKGGELGKFDGDGEDTNFLSSYRVKRGVSGANDFGPPIHVSSGILQLGNNSPSSGSASIGSGVQHYNAAETNPWQGSDLSGGYEVWLDTPSGGLQNYQPTHASGGIPHHPTASVDVGSVFSTNPVQVNFDKPPYHTAAIPMTNLPSNDGHLSGILHTQISSSKPYDPTNVVTGNVDFGNDASLKEHHSSLSYGR